MYSVLSSNPSALSLLIMGGWGRCRPVYQSIISPFVARQESEHRLVSALLLMFSIKVITAHIYTVFIAHRLAHFTSQTRETPGRH